MLPLKSGLFQRKAPQVTDHECPHLFVRHLSAAKKFAHHRESFEILFVNCLQERLNPASSHRCQITGRIHSVPRIRNSRQRSEGRPDQHQRADGVLKTPIDSRADVRVPVANPPIEFVRIAERRRPYSSRGKSGKGRLDLLPAQISNGLGAPQKRNSDNETQPRDAAHKVLGYRLNERGPEKPQPVLIVSVFLPQHFHPSTLRVTASTSRLQVLAARLRTGLERVAQGCIDRTNVSVWPA